MTPEAGAENVAWSVKPPRVLWISISIMGHQEPLSRALSREREGPSVRRVSGGRWEGEGVPDPRPMLPREPSRMSPLLRATLTLPLPAAKRRAMGPSLSRKRERELFLCASITSSTCRHPLKAALQILAKILHILESDMEPEHRATDPRHGTAREPRLDRHDEAFESAPAITHPEQFHSLEKCRHRGARDPALQHHAEK